MPASSYEKEIKPIFDKLIDKKHKVKNVNRIRYVDEDMIIIWFTVREHSGSSSLEITTDKHNRKQLEEACKEAREKNMKFFCCAVYDTNTKDKYSEMEGYIVSIESFDYFLKEGQSTISLKSNWEEIKNNSKDIFRFNYRGNGTSIAIIKKEKFEEYINYFDNRPYMMDGADKKKHIVFKPIEVFNYKSCKKISEWPLNLLVYGAPGTGKSNMLNEKLKDMKQENYSRITFYEDYTYAQFVGSYKPVPQYVSDSIELEGFTNDICGSISGEHITYKFVPGVFSEILVKAYISALTTTEGEEIDSYVLIIEELNRANAASVFGDLFQLLDREEKEFSKYEIKPSQEFLEWFNDEIRKHVDIQESIKTIQLLPNLHIWATMNSADQGVYPLDSAFKRRWGYIYKDINTPRPAKIELLSVENKKDIVAYSWDEFRNGINTIIQKKFDEDRCIGGWYFSCDELKSVGKYSEAVTQGKNLEELVNPLVDKLFSYLRQDVFRNNPKEFFNDDYLNMSKVRKALNEGKSLLEITKLKMEDFIVYSDEEKEDEK